MAGVGTVGSGGNGAGGSGTGGTGNVQNTGECGPKGATGYCKCQTFGSSSFSAEGQPCMAAGPPAHQCGIVNGTEYSVACNNSSCLWEITQECTQGCLANCASFTCCNQGI